MTTSTPHPSVHPSEHEDVVAPIRDDSMLGPTEDLDREPDGFPHVAIAWMALSTVVVAGVAFALWITNETNDVLFLIVAVPLLIYGLSRFASRKRDKLHPSR